MREEAFRRLQEEVIAVGGNVPQEVDSNISVEELVPVKNRHVSWSKLATGLQCELPNFDNPKWAMWFSMLSTYPFVCVFMVLLLMPILMFLGIAEEAPWYIMIILGPFVFIATLFLGVVTANKAESLLFRHPMRIPFDSIGEFTTYIALNARGIRDSLRKQVSTSIDTYVRQVVAKEFGHTPGQIDDKFKLVPSSEP